MHRQQAQFNGRIYHASVLSVLQGQDYKLIPYILLSCIISISIVAGVVNLSCCDNQLWRLSVVVDDTVKLR